jgi:hypothetical protein
MMRCGWFLLSIYIAGALQIGMAEGWSPIAWWIIPGLLALTMLPKSWKVIGAFSAGFAADLISQDPIGIRTVVATAIALAVVHVGLLPRRATLPGITAWLFAMSWLWIVPTRYAVGALASEPLDDRAMLVDVSISALTTAGVMLVCFLMLRPVFRLLGRWESRPSLNNRWSMLAE